MAAAAEPRSQQRVAGARTSWNRQVRRSSRICSGARGIGRCCEFRVWRVKHSWPTTPSRTSCARCSIMSSRSREAAGGASLGARDRACGAGSPLRGRCGDAELARGGRPDSDARRGGGPACSRSCVGGGDSLRRATARNEGVALILSCRTGHITSRQLAGIETLALDGLDVAATAELLAGLEGGPGRAPSATRARSDWRQSASGHRIQRRADGASDGRGTAPETASRPRRETRSRYFLSSLAKNRQIWPGSHASSVHSAARRGVDAAVEAKLLRPKGTFLAFQHPLLRSAVLAVAGVASCRQTHRAIADTFDQEQDGQRRVWHLAAAAERPDVEAGDLLEQTAHDIRARRGPAASSLRSRAPPSSRTMGTSARADVCWQAATPIAPAWRRTRSRSSVRRLQRPMTLPFAPRSKRLLAGRWPGTRAPSTARTVSSSQPPSGPSGSHPNRPCSCISPRGGRAWQVAPCDAASRRACAHSNCSSELPSAHRPDCLR